MTIATAELRELRVVDLEQLVRAGDRALPVAQHRVALLSTFS